MKVNEHYSKTFLSLQQHSAKNMGSGNLDVLATPAMVSFMEETCRDLLNQYLSDDNSSVGTQININHISASKIGESVNIKVVITEIIKEKIIKFDITASNSDNKELANATHTRVIINKEKFLNKLNA